VRETLEAQVSLQFLSWTKLTMALATGSQHMNLLAPVSGAAPSADGAQAAAAVNLQSGSTATSIVLEVRTLRSFPLARCALTLTISGRRLCWRSGRWRLCAAGAQDVDYIRRVTFMLRWYLGKLCRSYAGRPLARRSSAPGAKLQAVTGFLDREGGSFYQEWSALFVCKVAGRKDLLPLSRLQTMSGAEE